MVNERLNWTFCACSVAGDLVSTVLFTLAATKVILSLSLLLMEQEVVPTLSTERSEKLSVWPAVCGFVTKNTPSFKF